jgi:hypothetical protein
MISFVASVKGIKLYLMRRIGFSATTFKGTVFGLPQRLKLQNSENELKPQNFFQKFTFLMSLCGYNLPCSFVTGHQTILHAKS